MAINIGLIGKSGKMGVALHTQIHKMPQFNFAGGIDRDLTELTSLAQADVLIDFSHPSLLADILKAAQEENQALVIGTTGFNSQQIEMIHKAADNIPILFSANFSLGIAYLRTFIQKMNCDNIAIQSCDIIESHHDQKKDIPSGTAIVLSDEIRKFLPNVHIHSIRAPQMIGTHEVIFHLKNERISLKHEALSRDIFAQGALYAAAYIHNKLPKLYTLDEVL